MGIERTFSDSKGDSLGNVWWLLLFSQLYIQHKVKMLTVDTAMFAISITSSAALSLRKKIVWTNRRGTAAPGERCRFRHGAGTGSVTQGLLFPLGALHTPESSHLTYTRTTNKKLQSLHALVHKLIFRYVLKSQIFICQINSWQPMCVIFHALSPNGMQC